MQGKTGALSGLSRATGWLTLWCLLAGLSGATHAFLRPVPVSGAASADDGSAVETVSPSLEAPVETEQSPNAHYDRSNPDFGRLQQPQEALQGLPRDRDGKIDWMGSLRTRAIAPRATVHGSAPDLAIDLDIVMRNTRAMPYVLFPHRAHTEWLACSNCHPAPFEARAGSTAIKMEDIFRGRFCGICHDRVAFVTYRNCQRCHSVPQPTPPN